MTPAPACYIPVNLCLKDGSSVVGWRVYDSGVGRSSYWTWGHTRKGSRLDQAGVQRVEPVSWSELQKERVAPPPDPLALEEVRCMVHRAILTDGTMRASASGQVWSSWDGDTLTPPVGDDGEPLAATVVPRFTPSARDWQNYLPVMGWFCTLRDKGKAQMRGLNAPQSMAQRCVVLRAYGLSFEMIGDRIDRTKQRASVIYKDAIEELWQVALRSPGDIVRLPRQAWDGRDHSARIEARP